MEQHNQFREAIENDKVVLGARAATFSENLIEVYGELGLDFVWLDFEHAGPSPWDSGTFERLTRAAEVADIELLVRIPYINQSLVRKTLDAGVRNLLIPRLETPEEMREAVEATRYVYDGEPGQRGTNSSRAIGFGSEDDYVGTEDENVCIGFMIEKREAVANLKDILEIPELGFVFLGPGDLSVQFGHPNDRSHEEVQERIEYVVDTATSAGVPVGGIFNEVESITKAIDDGYQIVRIGDEFSAARRSLNEKLSRIALEDDVR